MSCACWDDERIGTQWRANSSHRRNSKLIGIKLKRKRGYKDSSAEEANGYRVADARLRIHGQNLL